MSNSPANGSRTGRSGVGSILRPDRVIAPVRVLAFWTAVALPFLYLPLLAAGLERPSVTAAFIALLVCNAVALFVGHPHRRT